MNHNVLQTQIKLRSGHKGDGKGGDYMPGWAILIANNTWMQCITKRTLERHNEREQERGTHTHTITERYTEQHTRHYKSHLRVPATLGLHFLECRTNCLHLSWNIFMCWTSTCTPACMYGGGVEPWYCNQSLMTGCYLTPTSTWTRSSELAGLFLNTRTVSVIHSSIVGKVWEQLQCFNCASRDFTKRFYTKHSPGIPISLKGIITSHCVFF